MSGYEEQLAGLKYLRSLGQLFKKTKTVNEQEVGRQSLLDYQQKSISQMNLTKEEVHMAKYFRNEDYWLSSEEGS